MGAIANISLIDAETTPVTHVFNPAYQGLEGRDSIAAFEDRAANTGIAVGFYKVTMRLSRPTRERKTFRYELTLATPILENTTNSTVSGIAPAPTVSYTPIMKLQVVLPERASLQVRKNLRKMFLDLMGNTQVINSIEGLDFPY